MGKCFKRSHHCGLLTAAEAGQQVTLSGFKGFCNKHSFDLDKYYIDDFDFNEDDNPFDED